jgi:hypothetical protein
MKKVFVLLWIFVCALAGFGQVRKVRDRRSPAPLMNPSAGTTLPIRRVILYSNGVAYIERRGIINGDAEIDLSFKQSQIDDVLKSMVVLDLGQGKVGAVSYNSSMPASARTAEIPFSVESESEESDNGSGGLANVLSQLQGARVVVASSKGSGSGAILTVEKRKLDVPKKDSAGEHIISYSLVIASESGEISSFDLADIRSVKLLEEGTRKDLNEFANATASTRRRDAKTIAITSQGAGQREMVVSYTIAAPIWKTTYRVVLDAEGKPFFQGWAIVDNVSDESWENVQLSLISGSPVSFIQNLQKPLYRYRPIVPIPEDLNLKPQIYDPENESGSGNGNGNGFGSGDANGNGSGIGNGDAPPPLKSQNQFQGMNNNFIVSSGFSGTSVSDAIVSDRSGIETAATGEELGDLFEYRIEQPISVERNRSALIPIIQTKMEGERVSIFRDQEPQTDTDTGDEAEAVKQANPRPMSGLLLRNITAMTFEGGSMTVLDRDAYAGEALMERLKPKEQRLISFALDLGTLVRVEKKEDQEPAKLVKVVKGVFQVHYFKTDKKIYRLSNQTERPKVVYIEHPVRKDWVLSENSVKPDYTTARFYRFRVELKPFENREVTVAENLGMMDKYELSALSPLDLDLFVSRKLIDDATRTRLTKLIDLRMRINDLNTRLARSEQEAEEIANDQKRFRENIEALSKTPEAKQLIERYISKANEQESRIEQIGKDKETIATQKDQLERELATEIKDFEIK